MVSLGLVLHRQILLAFWAAQAGTRDKRHDRVKEGVPVLQQMSSAQEKAPRLTGLKERETEPSLGQQLPPARGVSLRGTAAANAFSPAPARFAGPLLLRELRNPNPQPPARRDSWCSSAGTASEQTRALHPKGASPCGNPGSRQRSLPAPQKRPQPDAGTEGSRGNSPAGEGAGRVVEGAGGCIPPGSTTKPRTHRTGQQSHAPFSMRLETVRRDEGHG